MPGKTALATLAAGLMLAACESATAPDAVPVSAVAHAVTENLRHVPFQFAVSTCEEDVQGSGILHILNTTTISAAQDTITAFHINARGTGVGSSSGATYRFNDTFSLRTNQISSYPLIVSHTEVLNLIGHGKVADLHARALFRMVFNADGIQTVLIDDVRIRCG